MKTKRTLTIAILLVAALTALGTFRGEWFVQAKSETPPRREQSAPEPTLSPASQDFGDVATNR